jgi:hypothetical protein
MPSLQTTSIYVLAKKRRVMREAGRHYAKKVGLTELDRNITKASSTRARMVGPESCTARTT